MAFMMPVMKNNFDIYKDSRSRKTSEGSTGTPAGMPAAGTATAAGRVRKVSECKSESFATAPRNNNNNAYRMQMQRCHSSKAFPRSGSRSMATSALSPARSFCATGSGSPPKTSPLAAPPPATAATAANNNNSGSQNDLSKFHLRLVDKLRKSFRKDSAKRS